MTNVWYDEAMSPKQPFLFKEKPELFHLGDGEKR